MTAAFSIFRFALAHKLGRHRPINQDDQPPLHGLDSSSPVSLFECLPPNEPVGERYAELSGAKGQIGRFTRRKVNINVF